MYHPLWLYTMTQFMFVDAVIVAAAGAAAAVHVMHCCKGSQCLLCA